METCYLIQARIGSSRYNGKVLSRVTDDLVLIDLVYKQLLRAKGANRNNIYVLTTNNTSDDRLVEHAKQNNMLYFRGDETNVFKRFQEFFKESKITHDYFFRICSDNPFIEPTFIDKMAEVAIGVDNKLYDYISYQSHDGKPAILTHYGLFCELIRVDAFKMAASIMKTDYQQEHVTPIFYQSEYFKTKYIKMPDVLRDKTYRFTIDTKVDADAIKEIIKKLDIDKFTYLDAINVIEKEPQLIGIMKKSTGQNPKEVS